jgi:hypothetical protein
MIKKKGKIFKKLIEEGFIDLVTIINFAKNIFWK